MKNILIRFVLTYLRFFARIALKNHHPIVIGVAGSVGKSSTRNALYAMLKEYYPTKMVYGNSESGIPLGILGITQHGFSPVQWLLSLIKAPFGISYIKGTTYLIVEMGIDEPFPPKNMSYLLTIVKPDIAISLNASATHTMQFEKLLTKSHSFSSPKEKREFLIQKIADEDTKIISQGNPSLAIFNADDSYITKSLAPVIGKQTQTTFQRFGKERTNQIWYESYEVTVHGTTFSFGFSDTPELLNLHFPNHILPQEYQEVFAPVIMVGRKCKLTHYQLKLALEQHYDTPKGRSTLLKGIHNSLIIDSSYNASKDAVIAFLKLVKQLHKETKRSVVFVFGDMRELGNESMIEHQEVATLLSSIVDYLYLIGPQTKQFVLPIVEKETHIFKDIQWFKDAHTAGKYLLEKLPTDALVLVKGSQNTLFLEESIKYILTDKKDEKKLCRQEDYWLVIKEDYFTRLKS